MSVQNYYYMYGAGTQPNRMVSFNLDEKSDFAASVSALSKNIWKEISLLTGGQIEVEVMSTSAKMRVLMERRKGVITQLKPNKSFQELSLEEKKNLIDDLEPKGSWRLEIVNGIGESPHFEKVKKITFFDPS